MNYPAGSQIPDGQVNPPEYYDDYRDDLPYEDDTFGLDYAVQFDNAVEDNGGRYLTDDEIQKIADDGGDGFTAVKWEFEIFAKIRGIKKI